MNYYLSIFNQLYQILSFVLNYRFKIIQIIIIGAMINETIENQNEEIQAQQEPINLEEEAQMMDQQLLEMELLEEGQYEQQIEQQSQKVIQRINQEEQNEGIVQAPLQVVKNPLSPYLMFGKAWKLNHPTEKFNMSTIGQIWKNMTLSQKQPYEQDYRERKKQFDDYQAALLIRNPQASQNELNGTRYIFPLSRVRNIMKQDSFYSAKVDATAAMSKATQYFAVYILQEIKKMSEGKNRIDDKLLYQCINNQRVFSFLECLIEDHNLEGNIGTSKEIKNAPAVRLEFEDQHKEKIKGERKEVIRKLEHKKVSTGQLSLDSFILRQR